MSNKYNLDNYIGRIVELIYPSQTKKIHGNYIRYPSAEVNLEDVNDIIDKIAKEMKERCIDVKTEACIRLVKNYNERINKANKWIEEHPDSIINML